MKLLEIIKKMTESKKATYQGDITFSYYKLILMYFSKHTEYYIFFSC